MAHDKFTVIEVKECQYLRKLRVSGERSKNWLVINNKKALLKRNNGLRSVYEKHVIPEDVLEKIAYEIGKLLSVECAEIELATENGNPCCYSYDYNNEFEEFHNGIKLMERMRPTNNECERMINSVIRGFENIEIYSKDLTQVKKANVTELKREFFKMILFDCLLFNKETEQVRFVPLFDFDLIFLKNEFRKYNGFNVESYSNLVDYVKCNYYSDTIEFVNKISQRINETSILNILNKFDNNRGIDKKYILDYIMCGKGLIIDKYSRTDRFITNLNNDISEKYLNDNKFKHDF